MKIVFVLSVASIMAACAGESTTGPAPQTTADMSTTGSTSTASTTTTAATPTPAASEDIIKTAESAGKFKTLTAALAAAGLTDTLKGTGPFTVFAPTDDAFAKLPPGTLDKLMKNTEELKKVLTYHVVAGKNMASDVTSMKPPSAKTVEGDTVSIKSEGSTVMVNNAKVVMADVSASNGVIHAIDTVLMPPATSMSKGSKK